MSQRLLSLTLFLLPLTLFAAPERQRIAVYYGGSGADAANAVALDADGNAYVAGATTRTAGRSSAFVSKTKADGTEILWTAYLPGDSANAIAVDAAGSVWVAGTGFLTKLNGTDGQLERSLETPSVVALAVDAAGGVYTAGDGWVTKYVGFETAYTAKVDGLVRGLAVDGSGSAYVAYGQSLTRLTADGSGAAYTVDLGFAANAVAVDGIGSAFVTGANARLAKVLPSGEGLAYSVDLSGVLEQEGRAVTLDAQGNIYVAGWTNSSDFARARGWHGDKDGFLVKLNPAGEVLETIFAGTATRDSLNAVAVSPAGDVFLAGWTETAGMGSGPLALYQGGTDAVLVKFAAGGDRAVTGTTTVLTAAPAATVTFGQASTLTATVSPSGATGKVTFYDGTTVLGISSVSGGVATLITSQLPMGTRSLRAYYGGDVNFSASVSATLPRSVVVVTGKTFAPLAGSTTSVGSTPLAFASADFNLDGRADLAVVNNNSNSVTVLLGAAGGGFTSAGSPLTVGVGPTGIATGDFNGDGRPDIVVANSGSNTLHIFLGNGSGGFSSSTVPVVGGPWAVAVSDFNADGVADLAVAQFASGQVSILLGSGTGTFTAATGSPISVGGQPVAFSVADLNADGKADLAVANFSSNNVAVLLGSGTGTFTAAAGSPVAAGVGAISIATGDLNGDGKLDMAIANYAGSNVTVVLGDGAGGFTAAPGSPVTVGSSPRSVVALDFDGDGKLDLAVANSGSATVTILQGNGAGGFTAGIGSPLPAGDSPVALTVGEFTGDGRADLVVLNSGSNNVVMYPGVGDAPLVVSGTPTSTTASPQTITFRMRDANGAANLQRIYFLVATTPNVTANSCHGFYDIPANGLFLYNDSLSATSGPLTPGTSGTIQNTQCAINGALSSVSSSGTDLVLSMNMARQGSYTNGTFNVYIYAVDQQANGSGWTQTGTWGTAGSPVPPTLAASSPSTSTSLTQLISMTGRDGNGAADIQRIYFLLNTNTSIPTGSCHGFYDRPSNSVFLYNDSLTALLGPITPGSAGTVQNGQCAIDGATSSASASGTDVVLNLNVTRQGVYSSGTLNFYAWVVDFAGTGTGWVQTTTWTSTSTPAPPTLASATPGTTSASSQTFSLTGRDANGFADIQRMYFLVNSSTASAANSCHGYYDRQANLIFLYNDALSATTSIAPGTSGTIQNSRCAISGGSSSAASSGTDVTLNLNITRQGSYATGTLNLYVWVVDFEATGTGWVQASTWSSGSSPAAPTLALATPGTATTAAQTFALTGRDTNGYTDIQRFYFLVNSSTSIPANTCHGYYDRPANQIVLYNDALSATTSTTPGSGGTIQNSQCAINGAASSVSGSGTDLVLNLNITRQGAYATGSLNLYVWVIDSTNLGTGWVQASTWNLSSSPVAPTLNSATPSTTSLATQTFALTGRDGNGATDMQRFYFLVNTSTSIPTGTCHGYYDRPANLIVLYNDALNSTTSITPGAGGTIQNSQCAINGASSSVSTSGTDLTLNLSITRQGSYATGSKNLYIWIVDSGNLGTNWVQASTWTL